VEKTLSEAGGVTSSNAEVTQLPKSSIPLDAAAAGKVLRLLDVLEDLDDVQAVYANYEISDELMAELAT
jgi:transcriptional/translational regulatory protein YebC/TACO1